MSKLKVSLHLEETLVNDADKFGLLSEEYVTQLLQAEIERLKNISDDDWEEQILSTTLGDVLNDDNQFDFDKLRTRTVIVSPDEVENTCNS